MRRALVLTDERARHPFRASLPMHIRDDVRPLPARGFWTITKDDVQGFASAYVACFAAALVFIF